MNLFLVAYRRGYSGTTTGRVVKTIILTP